MADPGAGFSAAFRQRMFRWRWFYRVRQFWNGAWSLLGKADEGLAEAVLSPEQLALFRRMPADARAHSLAVLSTLHRQGSVVQDLAAAALLHDVGKVAATDAGAYLGFWLRGPLVLLEAVAPGWLLRLEDARPAGRVRYALYVHLQHPAIGARWAQAAGCSALTCWLIEQHQSRLAAGPADWLLLLERLQRADSQN
jgi:hypothetical protein